MTPWSSQLLSFHFWTGQQGSAEPGMKTSVRLRNNTRPCAQERKYKCNHCVTEQMRNNHISIMNLKHNKYGNDFTVYCTVIPHKIYSDEYNS